MTARDVGAAYDHWAQAYAERFGRVDAIDGADLDLVNRWRDSTEGPLVDAGCGPGQWVEVLGEGGREVIGLDASAEFLTIARRSFPTTPFVRASLGALPLRSGSVGGLLAWYSLIHTPPDALPSVLNEIVRVLRPGGSLVIGFVDGDPGQPFDHTVVTAYFWSVEAMGGLLADAGFEVVEHQRRQDPDVRPHAAILARRRP